MGEPNRSRRVLVTIESRELTCGVCDFAVDNSRGEWWCKLFARALALTEDDNEDDALRVRECTEAEHAAAAGEEGR